MSGTISQKITIDTDVFDEVRDPIAWFRAQPEAGEPMSIGSLIEEGAVRELERLRAEHRSGKKWPKRTGPLRTGRTARRARVDP